MIGKYYVFALTLSETETEKDRANIGHLLGQTDLVMTDEKFQSSFEVLTLETLPVMPESC